MGYTRKALATRARIIDCAAGLLVAQGYAQLKLDQVLAGAKVQKGNFYYYFPSKHDLCLAVLRERIAPQLLEWYQSLVPASHPAKTALENLPQQVTEHLGNSGSKVLDYSLLSFELANVSPEFRQELLALQNQAIAHFQQQLSGVAQAPGTSEDPTATSTALASLLNGALLRYRLASDLAELHELLAAGVGAFNSPFDNGSS